MMRNFRNSPLRSRSRGNKASRRNALAVLTILAITACLPGCASQPPRAEQARSTAGSGAPLVGTTWLLAGYTFQGQFIPLEPGHGSSALLVLREDGTLSGNTGTNVFSGTWKLGKARSPGTRALSMTITGVTKKASPNGIAARFEADFLREIEEARSVTQKKDSIQLLDGRDGILLRFIAANANGLY